MNETILVTLSSLGTTSSFLGVFAWLLSYPLTYGVPIIVAWFFLRAGTLFSAQSISFFTAGVFAWGIATVCKYIFQIPRPPSSLIMNPLFKEIGFSFPSGHSAFVAALAVVAFSINKTFGIVVTFFAILVGVSRIVGGVHYPTDVLAGWVLGVIVGLIVIVLVRNGAIAFLG